MYTSTDADLVSSTDMWLEQEGQTYHILARSSEELPGAFTRYPGSSQKWIEHPFESSITVEHGRAKQSALSASSAALQARKVAERIRKLSAARARRLKPMDAVSTDALPRKTLASIQTQTELMKASEKKSGFSVSEATALHRLILNASDKQSARVTQKSLLRMLICSAKFRNNLDKLPAVIRQLKYASKYASIFQQICSAERTSFTFGNLAAFAMRSKRPKVRAKNSKTFGSSNKPHVHIKKIPKKQQTRRQSGRCRARLRSYGNLNKIETLSPQQTFEYRNPTYAGRWYAMKLRMSDSVPHLRNNGNPVFEDEHLPDIKAPSAALTEYHLF